MAGSGGELIGGGNGDDGVKLAHGKGGDARCEESCGNRVSLSSRALLSSPSSESHTITTATSRAPSNRTRDPPSMTRLRTREEPGLAAVDG